MFSVEILDACHREKVELEGSCPHATAADPGSILIAQASADQFQEAIESLPIAFREALILGDVHGLEYREIAQIAAVPVGTVMSRLARARRHLGERLYTADH